MHIDFDGVTSYQNRHVLPNAAGVYYIVFQRQILYVGVTKSFHTRLSSGHVKIALIEKSYNLSELKVYFKIILGPVRWEVERKAIYRHRPPYNEI